MIAIVILICSLVFATGLGLFYQYRFGKVRATTTGKDAAAALTLLKAAGLSQEVPSIVHFSAHWCGPCTAVRTVITNVIHGLETPGSAIKVELDIDENPELARELSVLSLPTTFIYDEALQQRFRISGVPKTTELNAALTPLLGAADSPHPITR
ncbi:MAG: thioredoxin family protein [Mycobacteriaceae bacterium]